MALGSLGQGCAGRDAHPVALSQPQDTRANCDQIQAEFNANNTRIQQLGHEQDLKVAQNVVAGTAGVFTLGLAWFLLDAQGSAKTEADALTARNEYLSSLAASRCN
jgi:hypothetical protein